MSLRATPPSLNYEARSLSAGGFAIQTWALLVDVYRELQSKRLFWITLVISGIVVAAFAVVGFNDAGVSIFWKTFPNNFLNTRIIPKDQLYKNLFIELGVKWWLGWLGIILGLVSTAPMFPDFLGSGAVDLYLARPISRFRLLLTKYIAGLVFMGIQVAVFCLASFLVIGARAGVWVPGLFLAVPVVVLMFSYVWSICALLGVLTRSTVASLLLTLLAWLGIFGVGTAEVLLLTFSTGTQVQARELDSDIARYELALSTLTTQPAATQPGTSQSARRRVIEKNLETAKTERETVHDGFAAWHTLVRAAQLPLPKTSETTTLLERWLDRQFRGPRQRSGENDDQEIESRSFFQNQKVQRLTAMEVNKILRGRSAASIIGSSLFFEAVVLALATLVFVRRDY